VIHPPTDEVLEHLYYAKEEGRAVVDLSDVCAAQELLEAQLIQHGDQWRLSDEGERRARGIVRRHRLAEILFAQVLEVEAHEAERSACELEHTLSESVVDKVCTFLGHPPACPHGKPIPQGDCCRVFTRQVEPLITRLVDIPIGTSGNVVFIAPKSVQRLNRLAAFGVVPGSQIRLIEKKPSVIFACGQTSIAVEEEIGREIYVKRIA
jgi:DtxR family Mn-dependent transcriptional regulator